MKQKVILVLVDGMCPDGIEQCGNHFLLDLLEESTSCFRGSTTVPPVTLPCHTSLFFSVGSERHGIVTNIWRPMVRPIDSLGDTVAKNGKKAAMFYNWEELRDLNRPGSLAFSHYQTADLSMEIALQSERAMTKLAIEYILKEEPDFVFLYLGYTDLAGHGNGWLTAPYLHAVENASECIRLLKMRLPEDYNIIITADHGGHQRDHGLEIPEDMTIPIILNGQKFEKGKKLQGINIKDIAPTIAAVLDLQAPPEWEGRNILKFK